MGLDATYFSRRLTRAGAEPKAIVSALGGFAHGTRTYLVVSTIIGLIVAAIDTAFLWIVGVPLAARRGPGHRWISGLFASGSSAQEPAGEPAEGSSLLSPDAPEVPVRRYRRSGTPAADGQATGPGAGEQR